MNFFFDATNSPKFANTLMSKVSGHQYQILRDEYPADIDDEEWIPDLAKRKEPWIVVSGDTKRFKNPMQAAVLVDSGLMWVALIGKLNNTMDREIIHQVAQVWPKLVRKLEHLLPAPHIVKLKYRNVTKKGRLKGSPVVVETYCSLLELKSRIKRK